MKKVTGKKGKNEKMWKGSKEKMKKMKGKIGKNKESERRKFRIMERKEIRKYLTKDELDQKHYHILIDR